MNIYDIETFNIDRAIPYGICLFIQSKSSGNTNRDTTQRENEKCRIDCKAFKRTYCINEMLDYVLEIKGNLKKLITKILNIIYT